MQSMNTTAMRSTNGIDSKVATPKGKAPGAGAPEQARIKTDKTVKGFGGSVIDPKVKVKLT